MFKEQYEIALQSYLTVHLDFNVTVVSIEDGNVEIMYVNQSDEKDKAIKDCIDKLKKEIDSIKNDKIPYLKKEVNNG